MWPLGEFEQYLIAGSVARSTIRLRLAYLNRLARRHPDPWTITARDLVAWIGGHPHWKPETKRSVRSSLRVFWAWAVDFEYTDHDPTRKLRAVKVPPTLPKPAPADVLDTALAKASDRDRLMLLLAAHAGLRRAEIAAVAWADLVDGWLTVVGKGGRERRIPIGGRLLAEWHDERRRRLRGAAGTGWRYVPDPASAWVFPSATTGQHLTPDCVGDVLARMLGREWTAHTLRHRFATTAHQGTKDLRAVQTLLGHSSLVTTQRYVAVAEDELRAAVEAAAA